MPEIILQHITKRWDTFYAVDNLNLVIDDNAFVTLLGPSGCGKTTTLRMIAGLETPTSGRITIGGVTVFDSEKGINIPPNKRRVGFLFQNYALWPNMTVYQNISFGLSNMKEEIPSVDTAAFHTAALIRMLHRPDDLRDIYDSSRDKNGRIDGGRLCLRLIDEYDVSEHTAKALMGYRLFDRKDPAAAAAEESAKLEESLQKLREKRRAMGEELNDRFEILRGGQVQKSVRRLTGEEIDLRVRRVARIVKIGMFMERYPSELSGGQQQRVAIARTLAPEPKVLFMDEPLSNLDAKLRLEMRSELQRLHIETGSTFIYVTHDQLEAMTLATKICLINNGVLQQYDAPLDVYKRPANLFAADFVGNPAINFIEASGDQQEDGSVALRLLGGRQAVFTPREPIRLADAVKKADLEEKRRAEESARMEKSNKDTVFQYRIQRVDETQQPAEPPEVTDSDFVVGVRPEYLNIHDAGAVEGEIYSAMPTGMETMVKVRVGGLLLTGVVFGGVLYRIGQKIRLDFGGDNIVLFSRKNGRMIARGTLVLR